MYVKVPIVLLALVEGLLLVFATYLAAAMRFGADDLPDWSVPSGHLLPAAAAVRLLGLLSLFAFGLYSMRSRTSTAGMMVRVAAAVANASALSVVVFYIFPGFAVGRGVLGLTAAVAVVSLVTTRLLFERIVDQDLFKRRVLVYGAGQRAASLLELRRRTDQRGFRIVAFMPTEGDHVTCRAGAPHRAARRPVPLGARRTRSTRSSSPWTTAAVAFPMHELLECRLAGIEICELPTFLERETGKVRLDVLNPSWIIFGEGFRASPLQRALERGFDVVASLGAAADRRAVHAAGDARHQARGRLRRADPLPAAPRGPLRRAVRRAQVPQHARRRREGRRACGP